MFPKPASLLTPNSYAYETTPLVKPTGFREYDARWLFEKELNLMGVQALGLGLGTLIREMGVKPEIVTGHDYRGYSASIKMALINGLMASGCVVHDIGLAMSPMAYFAQFELDVPCVAMVTASHNDNGWTGVKMGAQRPVTFGPDEMSRLKEIVLNGLGTVQAGGAYHYVENFADRYIADLTNRPKIKRKLKEMCLELEEQSKTTDRIEDTAIDRIAIEIQLEDMTVQIREAMVYAPSEMKDIYGRFLKMYDQILEEQAFAREVKKKTDRDEKWRRQLLREHRIDKGVTLFTVLLAGLWMWAMMLSLGWLVRTPGGMSSLLSF